ncbi:MAG TPA: sulfate ABC transporter substrate-binding protein [Chthoniobacterales bacterium]
MIRPFLLLFASWLTLVAAHGQTTQLLNVSYDPTREFYQEYNEVFAKAYEQKTGKKVQVQQSHGGSSKQARSVIDGLPADVVTLGVVADIDALHANGNLVAADWQKRLPNNSVPYTSTVTLLVRKRNPKGIKDWDDLVKPGVQVITPNPKTSSGGRWNFLAAFGYALRQNHGDAAQAREFIGKLYQNVPVLDSGARGSTITFAQRQLGDVLIAWENEAYLTLKEFGKDQFAMIYPSVSIKAEPPVAVVDKVVDQKGTREVATAYLQFLFTPEAQELAARNFYRPLGPELQAKYAGQFPSLPLFTVDELFGGWAKAQPLFFADGGIFDQIYQH